MQCSYRRRALESGSQYLGPIYESAVNIPRFMPAHLFFRYGTKNRHMSFKDDRETIDDYHCSTFTMIAHEVNMSRNTVHRIVTKELDMQKICARLMPKNLSEPITVGSLNFRTQLHAPSNESWVFEYDPETK
ncbi:hypothetical protein Trydic_g11221 [Trypoxylus dichotomus]